MAGVDASSTLVAMTDRDGPVGHHRNWRDDAACNGSGSEEAFFPPPRSTARNYETIMMIARRYCVTCPVVLQCDAWATRAGERFGVWAGVDRFASPAVQDRQRGMMAAVFRAPAS